MRPGSAAVTRWQHVRKDRVSTTGVSVQRQPGFARRLGGGTDPFNRAQGRGLCLRWLSLYPVPSHRW